MCGVLLERGGEIVWHELPNVSPNPETEFKFDVDAYAAVRADAVAIVHSHDVAYPTEDDMEAQLESDRPWVVLHPSGPFAWGDPLEFPLYGRPWRYGVFDCLSLCRAYYRETFGIHFRDVARPWGWWNEGGRLYDEHLERSGFHEVAFGELRAGDGLLYRLRGSSPCHAAVYLGRHRILHHPSGARPYDPTVRSGVDSFSRLRSRLVRVVRHENATPLR